MPCSARFLLMKYIKSINHFLLGVPVPGDHMRKILKDGRVLVDVSFRNSDNVPTHLQRTVAVQEADRTERELRSRSLKFRDLIALTLRENNGAGMIHLYKRIEKDLGHELVDSDGYFADLVEDYLADKEDEGLATNTLANYASVIMRVLNRAKRKRQYQHIVLPELHYSRIFRNRVRTQDEIDRMDKVMDQIHSHLKPSIHFAERNPIRGRSDLWNLTRDNLILSSQFPPHIEFTAQKTSKKKPRATYLVELDDFDLQYFDWVKTTFPDCPFLFPGFEQNRFKGWRWWKMGNPRRHFSYICDKANVADFHFHDLKHEAITYMLHVRDSEGKLKYSVQDLKDLGIQFSDKAISVYLNLDAEYVLDRLACYSTSIGGKQANA